MTVELPPGWSHTKIGMFAEVRGGKRLPKGRKYSDQPTPYPYIRIVDFRDGSVFEDNLKYIDNDTRRTIASYTISQDDVYISIAGTIGVAGLIPSRLDGANLTENAAKIVLGDGIRPSYIWRFLSSPLGQSQIRDAIVATSQPKLALFRIESMDVPLPPLAEQRRIVAKIEALMARSARAKEALDAIPVLLNRYRQSVLAAAFRGDLTADWRAQHPDVEPASEMLERIRAERRRKWMKTETERMRLRGRRVDGDAWKAKYVEPTACPPPHGENIPPTWAWASVESLSTKVVDGVHKKPDYVDGGIPFVTVRNLTAGPGINFSELNHISPEDHQEFIKRAHPESGDILISKDGTLGVVRAIRTNIEFSIFVSVAMIKPVDKKITDYLEWALSCPQVQRQMVGATKAQFSSLDQAILAKAFRGELVPQDPNDEPASELLARINTERTATGTPSRRGGRRKRAVAPVM